MLNKGSRMTFGKLTKLKKLKSVAEYNDRYFVIEQTYTIDIEDRNKVKELQFLIISPTSSGKLVRTQKVVR
jgi:hypothetical protein